MKEKWNLLLELARYFETTKEEIVVKNEGYRLTTNQAGTSLRRTPIISKKKEISQ